MRLQGASESRLLIRNDFFFLGQTDRVLAISEAFRDSLLKSVKRWYKPRALLGHKRCTFVIEHGAMFDAIYTCAHCRLDTLGPFGVNHDTFARAMRDLNGLGYLFFAELLHFEVAG